MSKTKSRSTLLLKIISVLFIIYGVYFVVGSLLSLLGGTVVIPGMSYLAAGFGWVGALLEFIAGYLGFKCKNRPCVLFWGLLFGACGVTLFTTITSSSSVWDDRKRRDSGGFAAAVYLWREKIRVKLLYRQPG